ncbi:unnamed protein product [Candida verbasci]|uniref:MINDY deubiquitinase domain-containing protein n=1 Tax=Candida verbasci TaxID=1227364 RepID=A0A9W4TYJ4_9ASCO|nr:unnamed protein product [Candida verbasci]
MTTPDLVKFPIKLVDWTLEYLSNLGEDFQLKTPILLQEKNGPCPLISLMNTLIFKNESIIHEHFINDYVKDGLLDRKIKGISKLKDLLIVKYHSIGHIELNEVLSNLGELLLVFTENTNYQFEVDQLLEQLPKLHTGLDVNPNLINGEFEPDLGTTLFSIFDLQFRHGWVINQIDDVDNFNDIDRGNMSIQTLEVVDNYGQLVEIFNDLKTFDKIQDYLLDQDESTSFNQRLISKWLDLNKTQLTTNGLQKLNYLDKGEFIIFFRNNHFNTLFKKNNNEFYLIVTDSSFINKSSKIIWQSLNSVNGKDDLFFTGDFYPVLDIDDVTTTENQSDYLLSKQLQEEEDRKLAEKLENRNKKKSQPQSKQQQLKKPTSKPSKETIDKDNKKKKLNCCIV